MPLHLAGQFDGRKEASFYVNGKFQGRSSVTGAYGLPFESPPFVIGAEPKGAFCRRQLLCRHDLRGPYFQGRPLPQGLHAANAFRARCRDDPALSPRRGAGDVAHDASGHGYNGKIVAAKWVPGKHAGCHWLRQAVVFPVRHFQARGRAGRSADAAGGGDAAKLRNWSESWAISSRSGAPTRR